MGKTSERRRVDDLCLAALELEEGRRAAFLDQACDGDEDLRREVESLLAQEGKLDGDFLEAPALEVAAKAMAQDGSESLVGQEVRNYKVLGLLGEGGMGQVYLAQDTGPLDRKVALKFLPEDLALDGSARTRFQREARSAASLDHPYICKIYETGEVQGRAFIAMEHVAGETLKDRLSRAPLTLNEVLQQATEIAEALETAHERNIVHRDLKPSNIMLTPDGHVKVMDFGLAKRVSQGGEDQGRTVTASLTRTGTTIGTAAYMSPEQVRGENVDSRTDVWSFGLVLFEMLTGRQMYDQPTVSETIAAVLHQDPSLEGLPKETPWRIRELLERCLQKDRRIRLQHMGDARIEIGQALQDRGDGVASPMDRVPTQPLSRRAMPLTLLATLLLGALITAMVFWIINPSSAPPAVTRSEIPVPTGEWLNHDNRRGLALSRDGRQLAFVSSTDLHLYPSEIQIHVRSLDQWTSKPLQGVGREPMFSPDGKWLAGFFLLEDGSKKLQKYPLDGEAPTTIGECNPNFGASWGSDDHIIMACGWLSTLWRVPASGGEEPVQITELDEEAGEGSHRLPHVLPRSKAVLFTALRAGSTAQIEVLSLETGERRVLIEDGMDARYATTGHLVYALAARGGST